MIGGGADEWPSSHDLGADSAVCSAAVFSCIRQSSLILICLIVPGWVA